MEFDAIIHTIGFWLAVVWFGCLILGALKLIRWVFSLLVGKKRVFKEIEKTEDICENPQYEPTGNPEIHDYMPKSKEITD